MKQLSNTEQPIVALTDGATVTIDPTDGRQFSLVGSVGRTLAIGTAGYDGQLITIRWTNSGGSPITHTLDTGAANKFRFIGPLGSLNATAAGVSEYLTAQYHDADDRWDVIEYSGMTWDGLSGSTQSGTSYSLAASDKGKEVRMTNAAAKTVTIDATGTLGLDFVGVIANMGAGPLTLAPGSGVTLRKNIWKIGQYKRATVTVIGTDEYLIDADEPDPIVALTDGANIATDCSLGTRFRVTLGGNRTLDNPTGMQDGFQYVWEFLQDATGSRTITLGSKFRFGTDITALTLTTTASKKDFVTAIYNSAADKFDIVGVSKGY